MPQQEPDYLLMARSLGHTSKSTFVTAPTTQFASIPAKEPDFNAIAHEIHHGNPKAANAPDIQRFRQKATAASARRPTR